MNFSAHAIDGDKPFLFETGYRSFMGVQAELVPGRRRTGSPWKPSAPMSERS